jgi:uncharacterized protein YcbK (DUF882 family)
LRPTQRIVAAKVGAAKMGSWGMRESPVQDVRARKRMNSSRKTYAGGCSAFAVIALMMGSQGLETAVANGDTRTISLHHIHTNEDITITFKRDGRYDDEALKKLNWFVRDWRKEEEIAMDPRLFDLVWEASREVGGNKVIHVVCGYRSPETNAMLHARSNGVAKFSQHMLGKAMDFYIPGASLEELRNAGLRLERGGVGYYPTSGSPFVHLDVGNVRHWGPPISDDEMAKIMSGHPVRVAALGASPAQATQGAPHKKIPVASSGADEDAPVAAKPAAARPAAVHPATFMVASLESKPAELGRPVNVAAAPAVPIPHERPAKAAAAAAATSADGANATASPDRMRLASAAPTTRTAEPQTAGGVIWPVRDAGNDHMPLDIPLAYAAPQSLTTGSAMRPEMLGAVAATPRDNTTTVAKKTSVRSASLDQVAQLAEPVPAAASVTVAKKTMEPLAAAAPTLPVGGTTVTTKVVNANAGMRYDDPWLRAMIMTPSIADSMTTTLYGRPDLSELRNLMHKPNDSLMLSFNDDPYSGVPPDRFRGDAVVFLTTHAFAQHTAALR